MHTDVSKLAVGLGFVLGFPIVGYATGVIWNRMVGRSFPKLDRAWATFCLLMPIIGLGMIVKVGFETVRAVWQESPILASLVYLFFAGVVPAALIYVIIRLWRPRQDDRVDD